MKTRTSCYSSSAVCALRPVCNISHFCRPSTSPLHFHLCASRQQGKQQWAFYFDLSFGFPHDLSPDLFANRHKPTGFTSLPQSRRILPSQNRGYQFFYVAVWILLLFYHGYIWESIEIRGNVSIHVLEKNAIQPELFCTLPSFAWKLQMKSSMDKMCGHIVVQGVGGYSQVW